MNDISSVSNAVEMTCLWRTRPWRMSIDLSSRENVVPEGLLLLLLFLFVLVVMEILSGGGHEDFDMMLVMMLLCMLVSYDVYRIDLAGVSFS